jgi:hypothetical protein
MAKRALLHFACALLLLVAQHGALTHSVWHLHDHLPAHEQQGSAGAAQHPHDDGQNSQSRLCDLHFALGALLAGGCGGKAAAVPAAVSHWLATPTTVWRVAQSSTTPPSRAPPVLL